jgi:hypothetical protein
MSRKNPDSIEERILTPELPNSHKVPVSWLREHASPPIKWRTVRDILPPEAATLEQRQRLLDELRVYKPLNQILKKQKPNGTWGDNILGIDPARWSLSERAGTVSQYRRLIELGVPREERAYRAADRVFFRLLSRDVSPELFFEFRRAVKTTPELAEWSRALMREAATAALAHGGCVEDPRVRGAAHRIVTEISQFLRSELAESPFVRKDSRTILHPEARPPTLFSVAMVAWMPNLQRERAGFVERLAGYLARPAPNKSWSIMVGKRIVRPWIHLLGDPIQADSAGRPKDLPLALHWIELLVRMGALHTSRTGQKVLIRLLSECDERGVWSPKNLRRIPRSPSKLASFAFPLETESRKPESRQADVTFRLSLIAKLAGWHLEYT